MTAEKLLELADKIISPHWPWEERLAWEAALRREAAGVSKDTRMSTALEKLAEIEELDSCGRYGRLAREATTALRTIPSSDQCVAREALERQCDNMAFVLNHMDVGQWFDKFDRELREDRAALAVPQAAVAEPK